DRNLDESVLRQRPVVLRDLIAFRQVRVKIILAGPLRFRVDRAIQADSRLDRHGYSDAIQYRQGAGQTQTPPARIHVGRVAGARGTRTEKFGPSEELGVTFQPNDSFILRIHAAMNLACSILRARGSYLYSNARIQGVIKTIEWTDEGVRMIDQRKLPATEE